MDEEIIVDSVEHKPSNVPMFPTAFRYAGIGVLIVIIYMVLLYVLGLGTENWANSLRMIIPIILYVMVQLGYKELRAGNVTYGDCFKVGMLTTLLFILMAAIWYYVFTHIIAPEMMEEVFAKAIADMEDRNMSDEQMEQSLKFMEIFRNPVIGFFWTIGLGIIGGLIVNSIAAIFVSKK